MMNEQNIDDVPVRFSYYECAGDVTLLTGRRYSFLFVLVGSMKIISSWQTEIFASHTLAVVDTQKISRLVCTAGTTLLEFIPPKRIDHFFSSASTAFGTSCSEHIPFTPEIEQWIEQLRNNCLLGIRPDEYSYCCQLRALLRQCPDIVVGTLVIPLYACALSSKKCAQCRDKCLDTHEKLL